MNSFMITQNPSPHTQQQVHDYYKQHGTLVVTQQEQCKSGQVHHHVYIQTFLTMVELLGEVQKFNPAISDYTNIIKKANTFGGSMKYLFKEEKKCQPLLYGVSYEDCKKAINRYKNNARTNLRKHRGDELIQDHIKTSIDYQNKLNRLHKEQRAIVDIALKKSVDLLQLYRDIEDIEALQEEYVRFQDLLEKRCNLLTSDEIFNIYKEFATIYIHPSIYNYGYQTSQNS